MESANFTLETLSCPAGYVLQPHTTQTGISVCTCNEEIADLLLCEDNQETVVIRVSGRVREGRREGGREGEGGRVDKGGNVSLIYAIMQRANSFPPCSEASGRCLFAVTPRPIFTSTHAPWGTAAVTTRTVLATSHVSTCIPTLTQTHSVPAAEEVSPDGIKQASHQDCVCPQHDNSSFQKTYCSKYNKIHLWRSLFREN